MGRCCVKFCNSKEKLHGFPKQFMRFMQWSYLVGHPGIIYAKRRNYQVCDLHFTDEMKTPMFRSNLRLDAFPVLYMPDVTMLKSTTRPCNRNTPFPDSSGAEEKMPSNAFVKLITEMQTNGDFEAEPDPVSAPNEIAPLSQSSISGQENIFNSDLHFEKPHFELLSSDLFGDVRTGLQVCRICLRRLSLSEGQTELSETDAQHIQNMITLVLPDLDLNMCSNNTCCRRCLALLKYGYELKATWLEAEEKLQNMIKSKVESQQQSTNVDSRGEDQTLSQPFPPSDFKKLKVPQRRLNEYGPGPYQCEECGLVYKQRVNFVRHVSKHNDSGPNPKKFMCEICGARYAFKGSLKKHIETHSLVPKIYECSRCKRVFSKQGNLRNHIAFRHTGGGVRTENVHSQCHICGKRLTSRTGLRKHLMIHTGNKRFQCNKCPRRCYTKIHLRKHLRVHDDLKYCCPFCGKGIKYEQSLQCHIRVFHMDGGKYVCEICDRPFVKKISLDSHRRRIHGLSVEMKGVAREEVVI